MLYSQSLLRRRLTIHDDSDTIANQLTLHTCEIEETRTRRFDDLIVIGHVSSTQPHPDADKLTVCQVDCGDHGEFQICCGASNVGPEMKVAVALPGAHLEAINLTIGSRKLRGVESNGMICAKEELGIHEDLETHGIWILSQDLEDIEDHPLGTPLAQAYPRLENTIRDVENKTITHRPDMMGHAGLARELYSIYHQNHTSALKSHTLHHYQEYAQETINVLAHNEQSDHYPIEILTNGCRAYYAITLSGIQVGKSSFHTRLQLIDLGLTPKNNRVDFSNIFMYQTGQPIHCFDADTITGSIIVRQANDQEVFVDLLGNTHTLDPDDIVIADEDKILALAGVMGGQASAVTSDTTNIVIELANFDPIAVRKTAIRHGLRSDASSRFEKNISPLATQSMIIALRDMITQMQPDLGTVQRNTITAHHIIPLDRISVERNHDELTRLIGNIPSEQMNQVLQDLGFEYHPHAHQVMVPRWRGPDDITIAADVAEEIVRIVGYDSLQPQRIPTLIANIPPSTSVTIQQNIETILTDSYGLDSVETYPWAPDQIYDLFEVEKNNLPTLQNPLQPEQSRLSHSLLYNLLPLISKNSKFYDTLGLYTIGSVRSGSPTVYADIWGSHDQNTQTQESRQLGIVLYDPQSTGLQSRILTAKHIARDIVGAPVTFEATSSTYFHPLQQAHIQHDKKTIGFMGRLHPIILEALKLPSDADLVYLTLDIDAMQSITHTQKKKYHTLQDHILIRDLSFVLDRSQTADKLISSIHQVDYITDINVFDIYVGDRLPDDKKAIALQISIYHPDNNLTTDQINTILDQAIQAGQKTGAILRKDFNA